MTAAASHIVEIEKAVSGLPSGRDAPVLESWRRCISDHGLDPAKPGEAYIVPATQLREHREQSEQLISIARSGVERLFRQVVGQNYVLLLCDTDAVTVDFFGDPEFEADLREAGLYLGAEWSEARAGTCGVGSCIQTGEAITVHQTDHFDLTHTPLSCTAAPIYDLLGNMTAVLDISLLRSPEPKASQRLAQQLLGSAVRRIELANLMASMRQEWVLRFAHSPEFLDVDPEAAIALDGAGRIIGMTHGAARLLDQQLSPSESVLNQSVSRFFELSIDDLPMLTRSRPSEDRIVRLHNGSAVFAHAIEPPYTVAGSLRVRGPAIPSALKDLSGEDPAMRTVQAKAMKLANGRLPILLHGETGTGKERLARALHAARQDSGRFVALNCAAIPESLIESELFGHAPGAFTGALSRGKRGVIEDADGGVLFLDEIGDMPLELQARLLRVLSEGEYTRVGDTRPRKVDVKVISASHRDLAGMVREGSFREDLFYRLAAATLVLPPLRERTDFDWLLNKVLSDRVPSAAGITAEARELLSGRHWPGNIRELINTVEVAAVLAEGEIIEADHLPEPAIPEIRPAADLRGALDRHGWNVSRAARALGVDRATIYRRMRRENLKRPSD